MGCQLSRRSSPNFLDLPPELRIKVYRNLYVIGTVDLTDKTGGFENHARRGRCSFCPTLVDNIETPGPAYNLVIEGFEDFVGTYNTASSQFLQCSKLIYYESITILYGANTFWLTNACQLKNFLYNCNAEARSSISSLMFKHATVWPDLRLLPNLKKLEFYDYSHSIPPWHEPSDEWNDNLLLDTSPYYRSPESGNPGDAFLRRLYKKYPHIECGILINQNVSHQSRWKNRDYWVSFPSSELCLWLL